MSWTNERIEQLKKLWRDGLSASEIASQLGGCSRNGVIGKVHRLGLSGRPKTTPTTAHARPRKPRSAGKMLRIDRPAIRGTAALAELYELEPQVQAAEIEIPVEQRRTLLELKEEHCRWPVGDPGGGDFFFCGGKALGGDPRCPVPYCAGHARMAYQPAAVRQYNEQGQLLTKSGEVDRRNFASRRPAQSAAAA